MLIYTNPKEGEAKDCFNMTQKDKQNNYLLQYLRRQATNFRVKHYDVLGRTYSNYTLDQVSCSQLLPVLNLLSYP